MALLTRIYSVILWVGNPGSPLIIDLTIKGTSLLFNLTNVFKQLQFSTTCWPEGKCLRAQMLKDSLFSADFKH
jgi:hypothetical protein